MLQQVILAEKTKFIYRLISSVLQAKNIDCYVAEDGEDFFYQIDELRPQVIVVNLDTVNFEWAKSNLEQAKFKDYLKIGLRQPGQSDPDVTKYFDRILNLPIEPYEFVTQIKKWSEAH